MPLRTHLYLGGLLFATITLPLVAQNPDAAAIIKHSAETNNHDFADSSNFNFKETDQLRSGTRTYQVTMIEGTPYQRLIALNGKPLGKKQAAAEQSKQAEASGQRKGETAAQREERISKYKAGQKRDDEMISQLSAAFAFTITGEDKLRGFDVWMLKATPRAGYKPPSMQAQVLRGMQGTLWIDKQTYEWVKVTAVVTHPVSIEGFLAQVEPGTTFEIEKGPVEGAIWQITHYSSRARAKVFHMFKHNEQEESTFFDFKRVPDADGKSK